MEKIKISVTAKDIRNGKPLGGGRSCPIARAVRRCTRTHKAVSAIPLGLYIGKAVYDLPTEAIAFMDNFDNGRTVKPFAFVATRA